MRNHQTKPADADMTPMLDIVFILLIFFIVTAIFIKETALDMTPPAPGPITNPPPISTSLVVRITEENLVYVGNRLTEIGSIDTSLQTLLAEDPDAGVLVQAHPEARNRLVILAVDQAYSAGAQRVGFAVDSVKS